MGFIPNLKFDIVDLSNLGMLLKMNIITDTDEQIVNIEYVCVFYPRHLNLFSRPAENV